MAKAAVCRWVSLRDTLAAFVTCKAVHQGQKHIKPLHWYVACRLVLEGGFFPEEITPRPPFTVERHDGSLGLEFDPDAGRAGERTVFGGLKTKDVDVVVTKEGIGPVVAISCKGALRAFRNLTNRMEEAIGDCTNLHIAYPALVYGFLMVIRANREGPGVHHNDVAVCQDGSPSDAIRRYHDVMARLTHRRDLRNETSKYEAVALARYADEALRALLAGPWAERRLDEFRAATRGLYQPVQRIAR